MASTTTRPTTIRPSMIRPVIDPIVIGGLILLTWYLLPGTFDLSATVLPGPGAVWDTFQLTREVMIEEMLDTLSNFGIGFVLGVAIGLLLAVACLQSRVVNRALSPFLVGIFVIPKAVFVPLFLLWFGTDNTYKIVIVAAMAFFPVFENAYAGMRGLPSEMVELATVLRARWIDVLLKIKLPAAMPGILAGVKLGLAEAFIGIVLCELLAPTSGIGALIINAAHLGGTTVVLAGILMIATCGLALYFTFDLIERRATFWRYE
jgi:ABC-type nitrate/sulfonate/bicarbonate transport system permease component